MALAPFARSKHRPFVSGGAVTFTGNTTIRTGFAKDRPLRSVVVTLSNGGGTPATVANAADAFTFNDNGDGTITIYAWMNTSVSNPTLIAATGAVTALVRIEVD
jgi:hypothetical protein